MGMFCRTSHCRDDLALTLCPSPSGRGKLARAVGGLPLRFGGPHPLSLSLREREIAPAARAVCPFDLGAEGPEDEG